SLERPLRARVRVRLVGRPSGGDVAEHVLEPEAEPLGEDGELDGAGRAGEIRRKPVAAHVARADAQRVALRAAVRLRDVLGFVLEESVDSDGGAVDALVLDAELEVHEAHGATPWFRWSCRASCSPPSSWRTPSAPAR